MAASPSRTPWSPPAGPGGSRPRFFPDSLRQDARYAARIWSGHRAVWALVVLILAVAIGATAAIFSIINSWLFRPLPVSGADRLVVLASQDAGRAELGRLSYRELTEYRDQQGSPFSDLLAYTRSFAGLSTAARTEWLLVNYVSGNYFTMLGVKPALGRLILPSEGAPPGIDPVAVLGYGAWKRKFGGDPSVIGRDVLLDGHPVTIIGVADESFHGLQAFIDVEAYLPLNLLSWKSAGVALWNDGNERRFDMIGRLKPEVSLTGARAWLDIVSRSLAGQYPDTNQDIAMRAFPERFSRPDPNAAATAPMVAAVFLALSAVVLTLACFNVTNMLLVHYSARQHEFAVRATLGATTRRIYAQLLTETLLLAMAGGMGGLLIASWLCAFVSTIPWELDMPVRTDFGFDWRVFLFSFVVIALTGIGVSLAVAWRVKRCALSSLLSAGSRHSGSRDRRRTADALVAAQVGASVVLLVVAGLFVRSLQTAMTMDLGFDPDRVLNASMDPRGLGYTDERGRAFYQELLHRVRALPGVQSASLASSIPFGYRHTTRRVVAGRAETTSRRMPEILENVVTPEYFRTVGVPLVRGRSFTDADNEHSLPVAIVNESMARRFWPGEDAIGQQFVILSDPAHSVRVIGVAADGKYRTPADRGVPYFYVPWHQVYRSALTLQVRSALEPELLAREIQRTVAALEPTLPLHDVRTMRQVVDGVNGLLPIRLAAGLAGAIGSLGVLLASFGVYALLAYAVAQRTREFAIRMAMGSRPNAIVQIIVGQGMKLVIGALVIGLLCAVAAARLVSGIVLGVDALDLVTFSGAIGVQIAAAAAACGIPAYRAVRANLAEILRA